MYLYSLEKCKEVEVFTKKISILCKIWSFLDYKSIILLVAICPYLLELCLACNYLCFESKTGTFVTISLQAHVMFDVILGYGPNYGRLETFYMIQNKGLMF